jgi:hypothetical protein
MTATDFHVLEGRGDSLAAAVLVAKATRVLNRLTFVAPTPRWDG